MASGVMSGRFRSRGAGQQHGTIEGVRCWVRHAEEAREGTPVAGLLALDSVDMS
jgi:hypothetical protein